MQFALVIYENEADFIKREGPEAEAYWGGWSEYTQSVQQAGIMEGGAGLQPPSETTTVRRSGSNHEVQPGPSSQSKDHLGGFYLIDVPDLETAIEWASRVPITELGRVEIRPLLNMPAEV
ncbi:MAG: YciI family protein [Planctomycetota bacterium]